MINPMTIDILSITRILTNSIVETINQIIKLLRHRNVLLTSGNEIIHHLDNSH